MPRVLVAGKVHDSGLALLRAADGVTVDYVEDVAPRAYLDRLAEADALVIRTQPLTAEIVAAAPRLRIVARHGVGIDSVDVDALSARGIPLVVVGDVNSGTVAEHAMMLILAATHRLIRYDRAVRGGDWSYRNRTEAHEVAGKSLLIVGLGRIGRKLVALASAFGMIVRAYDPHLSEGLPGLPGVVLVPSLRAGLAGADVVSLHAPGGGGPAILGAEEIAAMKPGAVLVTAARGGLVDEAALHAALASGRLGAAGLDVFADEPPPADHPLLGLDNVVLTPHAAALTEECAERMSTVSAQNVLDFLAGRLDPRLVVNARPLGLEG